MLDGLAPQEVIGLFPEGGLDRHRVDEGLPGIGYLAIKSGARVIPASIVWGGPHSVTSMVKTIFVLSKPLFGMANPCNSLKNPGLVKISCNPAQKEIMKQIEVLRKSMLSGVS